MTDTPTKQENQSRLKMDLHLILMSREEVIEIMIEKEIEEVIQKTREILSGKKELFK